MMKTLKLKIENTKAYKSGYQLGPESENPFEDQIDRFRYYQGQCQYKREHNERERVN